MGKEACLAHTRLTGLSAERRNRRGECIEQRTEVEPFMAAVESGAGEVFQVVRDESILSSILLLIAERGAYYQSAGTSPEGMASGASHLLVYEIANFLSDRWWIFSISVASIRRVPDWQD